MDATPFGDFVTGPLNAGAFSPSKLDNTFGLPLVLEKAPATAHTLPYGFQFVGTVNIDSQSKVLAVDLINLEGDFTVENNAGAERSLISTGRAVSGKPDCRTGYPSTRFWETVHGCDDASGECRLSRG